MAYDNNGNLLYKGYVISTQNPAHLGSYIRRVDVYLNGVWVFVAKSIKHAKKLINEKSNKSEVSKMENTTDVLKTASKEAIQEMQDEQEAYTIIVKETHKKDCYDEDDNGNETHYLDGETIISFREIKGIQNLKTEVERIGDANADNPPYDEYEVLAVYETFTKRLVSEYEY